MSLICKKIQKIEKYFTGNLIRQLSNLKNENDLVNFSKDLNTDLMLYLNINDLNSSDSKLEYTKELLFQKILKNVKLQDNFGDKGYFNSLIIFFNAYKKHPNPSTKEKLEFLLNEINSNIEVFQKSQMENLVKYLQENPNCYQLKSGIKNFNLFPKRLIKTKLLNTYELPKSTIYNINIDVENNLIALQDKKIEDNLIIFCELGHKGISSINFYNSLMNTVNPNTILIENEPFEDFKNSENFEKDLDINNLGQNKSKSMNYFDGYLSDFLDINSFRKYLNENPLRKYILNNLDVIQNQQKEILEIESLIFSALNKKIKVNLFDLNNSEYINSLFLKDFEVEDLSNTTNENFLLKNKKIFSILNNLELSSWLKTQSIKGCKNCASFLTRNQINYNPLPLEFLIGKKNLPNYEKNLKIKSKKIFERINENLGDKYIIFSSDCLNLAKNFLEFSERKKTEGNYGEENEKIFEEFYNKNFLAKKNKNFSSETNKNFGIEKEEFFDIMTTGILLKQNFGAYYENLPFYLEEKNSLEGNEFKNLWKKFYEKNFEEFFALRNFNEINFEDNGNIDLTEFESLNNDTSNNNNNNNFRKENRNNLRKMKECVPHLFFRNLGEGIYFNNNDNNDNDKNDIKI